MRVWRRIAARLAVWAMAAWMGGCTTNVTDTDPRVTLRAEPRSGLAPLEVSFEAAASGGEGSLTYEWDFGDGTTASGDQARATATHVFDRAGTFTVTVTVADEDGDTASAEIHVAVASDTTPAAAASATPSSGSAPLAVDFECVASGSDAPLSVRWDFGDGSGAEGASAAHTYVVPGEYVATCSVTDADGDASTDRVTITVARGSAPIAVASATWDGTDVPLEVSFRATAVGGDGELSYEWQFGDGESAAEANPTHTYPAAGTYRAVLTVRDADGDFGVDTVTIVATTPVTPNLPPDVTAAIATGACAVPSDETFEPTRVQLDAEGSADPEGVALSYEWRFVRVPAGSLVSLSDPHVENPSFVPDRAGTYQVRVFVSDGVNRVASDVLTVTASGLATLTAVSGAGQTAAAGTAFAAPLVLRAQNACGAPVAHLFLTTHGVNMSAFGGSTDASGELSLSMQAGARAGAASLIVMRERMMPGSSTFSASFDFTVVAGPPARLVVDAAPETDPDDPLGMPITIRISDTYGNPTGSGSESFDLCTPTAEARLGTATGAPCQSLTASAGVATTHVFASGPGIVELNVSGTTLLFAGWAGTEPLDFETEAAFAPGASVTALESEWALGAPASPGPTGCASGTSCFGTVLGGAYVVSPSGIQTSWVEGEVGAWFLSLSPARIEIRHQEWMDLPTPSSDTYGCGSADVGGVAELFIRDGFFGAYPAEPIAGANVRGCMVSQGRSGTSGGWVEAAYAAFPRFGPLRLRFALTRGTSAATGAGWYIDDVEVRGYFEGRSYVRFVGPPACSNGVDDDGDGLVDFPEDPDCSSASDDSEGGAASFTCDAPEVIPGPGSYAGSTAGLGSALTASCVFSTGGAPEAVYTLRPSADARVTLTTCGSSFDTVLSVSTICGGPALACNDDSCGAGSSVTFDAQAGVTYYVVVDGYGGSAGSYVLNVSYTGGSPSTCMDGIDNDMDGWVDAEDEECAGGLPGAEERGDPGPFECSDGIDNDGDGDIDGYDADCLTYAGSESAPPPPPTCADADGDGFLDAGCCAPFAGCGDDCDDSNPDVSPIAPELCNGIDDNCDGVIDDGCP